MTLDVCSIKPLLVINQANLGRYEAELNRFGARQLAIAIVAYFRRG